MMCHSRDVQKGPVVETSPIVSEVVIPDHDASVNLVDTSISASVIDTRTTSPLCQEADFQDPERDSSDRGSSDGSS